MLDLQVAHTKGQSVKDSTKKNLLSQLTAYQSFCDKYRLQYFPVDNKQICRYGQHLAQRFRSPDAVGNYISAVRTFMALLGLPIPSPQEKEMRMFMQGLRRIMDHEVKQAAPITPELLIRMSRVVDCRNQTDMVAWVATLIGFTMFLRKSNLVPDAMEKFDPRMQFQRKDFNLTGPLSVMMAEISWAKNIQFQTKNTKASSATSGKQGYMPSNLDALHVAQSTSVTGRPCIHSMVRRREKGTLIKSADCKNQEMAANNQRR